jgi:hypothetical protein
MINSPSGEYKPKDLFNKNTQCGDDDGTKITLTEIQRKISLGCLGGKDQQLI